MISHPFEVKASSSDDRPDVLMVTGRGVPAQAVAEMYLPAVPSDHIIRLADQVYGRHRLSAIDANTVQFPASDLTLIPVPAGVGAYAGLLSIEAHPAVATGHSFSLSVRQFNPVTASIPRDHNLKQRAVEIADAAESLDFMKTASGSWRRVNGAFQFTFTGKSEHDLAAEQARLLAWLKWRVGVTPQGHRWHPVLSRYLKQTESLVWDLGTDPNTIAPSETGTVDEHRHGRGCNCGELPTFPVLFEHGEIGKVTAIHYDRFGDFQGFTLLTERGHHREYVSTERFVEELVRTAWVERSVLRVDADEHHAERPHRITLLRSH
ncbi:MAG: hypothetical protein ACTHJM_13915 [Marmoricola sp.]